MQIRRHYKKNEAINHKLNLTHSKVIVISKYLYLKRQREKEKTGY